MMEQQQLVLPPKMVTFLLFLHYLTNLSMKNGATPLMAACENGHNDVVQLLVNRNVPVHTQNEDRVTTFFW